MDRESAGRLTVTLPSPKSAAESAGVYRRRRAERPRDRWLRIVAFAGALFVHLAFLVGIILGPAYELDELNDETPPHYQALFDKLLAESSDDTVMIPFPIWREAFINDADIEIAKWTHSQLSPEPYQPLQDKLDLKKFYSLATPKSYINCTEDAALPQGEWGWHPRMSNRLGLYRLVQMPGSHEVIYTNPKGLAQKIIEAGRD